MNHELRTTNISFSILHSKFSIPFNPYHPLPCKQHKIRHINRTGSIHIRTIAIIQQAAIRSQPLSRQILQILNRHAIRTRKIARQPLPLQPRIIHPIANRPGLRKIPRIRRGAFHLCRRLAGHAAGISAADTRRCMAGLYIPEQIGQIPRTGDIVSPTTPPALAGQTTSPVE